ncbi:hypothetical protein L3V83_02635 [Thiotrichales bacterium 19X7-9]|nr:hypothetical protein [Thiotrichales bacterium 19X7-9]
MKIFLQLLVLFNIFISNVFASNIVTVNITNNINHEITISSYDKKCIYWVHPTSINIPAHSERSMQFKTKNSGFSCHGDTVFGVPGHKHLKFNVYVTNFQRYQSDVYWVHWVDSSTDSWTTSLQNGGSQAGLNITSNVENQNSGDFNFSVSLGNMPYGSVSLKTLGLGKISVTNGYGKKVPLSPFWNSISVNQLDKLFFHFSKSLAVCSAVNGVIKCPNGVSFVNIDRKVTFICTQTSNESPMCPYLNIKSSSLSSIVKLENIS